MENIFFDNLCFFYLFNIRFNSTEHLLCAVTLVFILKIGESFEKILTHFSEYPQCR